MSTLSRISGWLKRTHDPVQSSNHKAPSSETEPVIFGQMTMHGNLSETLGIEGKKINSPEELLDINRKLESLTWDMPTSRYHLLRKEEGLSAKIGLDNLEDVIELTRSALAEDWHVQLTDNDTGVTYEGKAILELAKRT